ncbi:glycosyltransferase family 4 protein [Azospirillum sp. B506]|uniref:glycosyltransferase family 4 protein n=1 Tax=Azospirillum sp. B506 TaxID=137721 RepID=UPI000678A73D|nr:glycosyltransferase [Azospirillum sp. B506]
MSRPHAPSPGMDAAQPPASGDQVPTDVPANDRWLDAVKETIWLTREDLRLLFKEDRASFDCWLLLHGTREYRALREVGIEQPLLTEPAPEAFPAVRPVLTRFLKQIWTMRADLQANFDLRTVPGQQEFVWWCFTHGMAELELGRFVTDEQKRYLNEPVDTLSAGGLQPVTRLMQRLWEQRPELQAAFPLDSKRGRAALIIWYFTTGLAELRLDALLDDGQIRILKSPVSDRAPAVSIASAMIWSNAPALQRRFPDPGDPVFAQWAESDGRRAHPLLERLAAASVQSDVAAPAIRHGAVEMAKGVNLIGYARGQLGIGEDVRQAAFALQAAGVPFSIYNIEPGREVSQDDHSVQSLIGDRLPYAVNLLCTTGIETARLAATDGKSLFEGRHTIGYWPWELPEWPSAWRHAYDFVDEIWASSRYSFDAYRKSSPKPVRHLPPAVSTDDTANLQRPDFGLPDDRFLFVFAFDALSSFSRKNPQACVRAFQQAFPLGREPVGLVIKAMRAVAEHPVWREILDAAAADPRIFIVDRTFDKAAVLDLYRSCDAFLSLHRAEGFGRGIAEAMMLGKPAIVTGFSGNMDFTTPGTAALVDHGMRAVAPGEYPFADGLSWADPDVDHAAWWMRRLVEDPCLRCRLADQGRALTRATYAPIAVGQGYAALLGHAAV